MFLSVCQKIPGLIRGRSPLCLIRLFAARERMREAKSLKLKKVAFSHFFDTLKGTPFPVFLFCYIMYLVKIGSDRNNSFKEQKNAEIQENIT